MFEALASLAQRRRKLVVIAAVVLFGAAGAIGSGVADRLDPYGADDPDTEGVIADERLKEAGFRDASVIVLIEDADVTTPAGARTGGAGQRSARRRPDVARVTGYLETRSPDFLSRDGTATYLAVALEPTEDKELQEAADRIREDLAGEPGVSVGGYAVAQEQVNQQVEEDLQRAEMLAFPLLFLLSFVFFRSLVAAALPLLVGGLAILGTFFALRMASELGSISIFALNLTTGLGPGSGDRLQPVHGLALPRGDRQVRARARGDEADDGNGRAHGPLLLAHGRRRARIALRLPAALPLFDGPRRRDRRPAGGGDLADRASGGAGAARQPRQLAVAEVPAAAGRSASPAAPQRVLVPALALRHAPPGPDRRRSAPPS